MNTLRIFTFIVILVASGQVYSEPKSYQKTLINEPLSLLDFTIYSSQRELEEYVEKNMLVERSIKNTGLRFRNIYEESRKNFDWFYNKKPDYNQMIYTPLNYHRADVEYNFLEGKFDIEVNFRWDWLPQYVIQNTDSTLLDQTKSEGVLTLNKINTAKLCEIVMMDLRAFNIKAITHEGYTNPQLKKIEGKLQQNIEADTRKKVRIHVDGSMPAGNWTYMTCDAKGHDYDYGSKIKYTYTGNWHKLEKIIKKRTTKKKDF